MSLNPDSHRAALDVLWNELPDDARVNGREEWEARFERGEFVYFKNAGRDIAPVGVGKGFPTRVNVNIGTSDAYPDSEPEMEKLVVAEKLGADAVMDLSTGGDLTAVRLGMLERSKIPLGTVPLYEMYIEAMDRHGDFAKMTPNEMLDVVRRQAEQGVDFMTIHAGISLADARRLREGARTLGAVSRGGTFLVYWMLRNKRDNPFLEVWDELMDVLRKHNVVLSLGDALRPGCIFDATDDLQISELMTLGRLKESANEKGVQVIVEGPGHMPLGQIAANMMLQKKLCGNAPFYVLGPLPTDIGAGYDHIVAAIGGAVAAAAGADFLCYVTPAEHLRLPKLEDVREGLIASKIAAHIGDLEKGLASAWAKDRAMDDARRKLDWPGQLNAALDQEKFTAYRGGSVLTDTSTCSMCGNFCAVKICAKAMSEDNS